MRRSQNDADLGSNDPAAKRRKVGSFDTTFEEQLEAERLRDEEEFERMAKQQEDELNREFELKRAKQKAQLEERRKEVTQRSQRLAEAAKNRRSRLEQQLAEKKAAQRALFEAEFAQVELKYNEYLASDEYTTHTRAQQRLIQQQRDIFSVSADSSHVGPPLCPKTASISDATAASPPHPPPPPPPPHNHQEHNCAEYDGAIPNAIVCPINVDRDAPPLPPPPRQSMPANADKPCILPGCRRRRCTGALPPRNLVCCSDHLDRTKAFGLDLMTPSLDPEDDAHADLDAASNSDAGRVADSSSDSGSDADSDLKEPSDSDNVDCDLADASSPASSSALLPPPPPQNHRDDESANDDANESEPGDESQRLFDGLDDVDFDEVQSERDEDEEQRETRDAERRQSLARKRINQRRVMFRSNDPALPQKINVDDFEDAKDKDRVDCVTYVAIINEPEWCWMGFIELAPSTKTLFVLEDVLGDLHAEVFCKIGPDLKRGDGPMIRREWICSGGDGPWEQRAGYHLHGQLSDVVTHHSRERRADMDPYISRLFSLIKQGKITQDQFFLQNARSFIDNDVRKVWDVAQKVRKIERTQRNRAAYSQHFSANAEPWMLQLVEFIDCHESIVKHFFEDESSNNWQHLSARDRRLKEFAFRAICWYYSNQGCQTKTFFTKYLRHAYPDKAQVFNTTNVETIRYLLDTSKPIVIFNLGRNPQFSVEFYQLIEELKDGSTMSTKYVPENKEFDVASAFVAVLCNEGPDPQRLSRDRYFVKKVTPTGVVCESARYGNPHFLF